MEKYSQTYYELVRLRRLEKNPLVQKPCPNCGQLFEARQISRKIYCSFECVQIAYHNRKKLERRSRGLKRLGRPRGRPKGSVSKDTVKPLEPIKRKSVNLDLDSIIEIPCAQCLAQNLEKMSPHLCNPNSCSDLTNWLFSEAKI